MWNTKHLELVQALGLQGISKSQVSVLCAELDSEVEQFRTRPLGEAVYPYVWLDATYVKARTNVRRSCWVAQFLGPVGAPRPLSSWGGTRGNRSAAAY